MNNVQKYKTYFLGGMAAVALIALAFVVSAAVTPQPKPKLGGFVGYAECSSAGSSTAKASSTQFTLNPGLGGSPSTATTTMVCDIGGSDEYNVNIYAMASSSGGTLNMTQEFTGKVPLWASQNSNFLSLATTTIINDVDWFNEDCISDVKSNTSLAHGNVCTHTVPLATSTNGIASVWVKKTLNFTSPAERFVRLNFSASSATSSVNVVVEKRLLTH